MCVANTEIAVNFTVGRGMSSGDGNAVDEAAEAMTFSDDFMRAHSGEALNQWWQRIRNARRTQAGPSFRHH